MIKNFAFSYEPKEDSVRFHEPLKNVVTSSLGSQQKQPEKTNPRVPKQKSAPTKQDAKKGPHDMDSESTAEDDFKAPSAPASKKKKMASNEKSMYYSVSHIIT